VADPSHLQILSRQARYLVEGGGGHHSVKKVMRLLFKPPLAQALADAKEDREEIFRMHTARLLEATHSVALRVE
jgi:hypothetical protein